jgi:hypothetical protein
MNPSGCSMLPPGTSLLFFDPAFVSAPGNRLPLYHHVFNPEHENLMFIGLLQTLWALMPVASRGVSTFIIC